MRAWLVLLLIVVVAAGCTDEGGDASGAAAPATPTEDASPVSAPTEQATVEAVDDGSCDYLEEVGDLLAEAEAEPVSGAEGLTDDPQRMELAYATLASQLDSIDPPESALRDHAALVVAAETVSERSGEVEAIFEEARAEARREAEAQGLSEAEKLARVMTAPGYESFRAWGPVHDAQDALKSRLASLNRQFDC